MTTMDEIRELQASLNKLYTSGSMTRLSERSAVQVMMKLSEMKLIEVIYTMDGKQYVTPEHLEKEIRDEIFVHNGRLHIVDLEQLLGIDISRVEPILKELLAKDGNIHQIDQDIIDKNYIDTTCEEINEMLQQSGQISIGDLCTRFDLPSDFLSNEIETRIGTVIQGKIDPNDRGILFTDAHLARQTARIRGIFSAITQPTQVSKISSQYRIPERQVLNVLQNLIGDERIVGGLQGKGDKSTFTPELQFRTQDKWADSFYSENGYLEYDALKRLGIKSPKGYTNRFKDGMALETCVASQGLVDNVYATVEEMLATGVWVDIENVVPSPFSEDDVNKLLGKCPALKTHTLPTFQRSIIVSEDWINKCKSIFDDLMKEKAKKISAAPKLQKQSSQPAADDGDSSRTKLKQQRREERKNRRSGKGGDTVSTNDSANTGGSKKGKRGKNKNASVDTASDSKDDNISFLTTEEIASILREKLTDEEEECSDEFLAEVAEYLHKPLTTKFQGVVRDVFLSGVEGANRKEDIRSLQDELTSLHFHSWLYSKGIEAMEGEDTSALKRHLLRTLCNDMITIIVKLQAAENYVALTASQVIDDAKRAKIIDGFPEEVSVPLKELAKLISGKEATTYLERLEELSEQLQIYLKPLDKKKDRQLTFETKHSLTERLQLEADPALVLHLTAVLLFQKVTGCLIHAPGKCVPQLITFLRGKIPADSHSRLLSYQQNVISSLSEQDTDQGSVQDALTADMASVKALALESS